MCVELHISVYLHMPIYLGLDNALRVFALHKDVQMNVELSQGKLLWYVQTRGEFSDCVHCVNNNIK